MKQRGKQKEVTWETFRVTLVFLIKNGSILMGEVLGGTIKGFITPPGGKRKPEDSTFKVCADRELNEETGFIGLDGKKVAQVIIKIHGKRRIVRIHAFKYTRWAGKLVVERREFSYLKFFPINKIPWKRLAPRDRDWMKPVLSGRKINATVICGENRTDVIKVTVRPRK